MTDFPVYRIRSETRLFGFADNFPDVSIANRPLKSYQDEAFLECGMKVSDVSADDALKINKPHFRFSEDLFFTKQVIRSFVSELKKRQFSESLRVVLRDNVFNERFALPHAKAESLGYDSYDLSFRVPNLLPPKGEGIWILPQTLYPFDIDIPEQMVRGSKLAYPLCDSLLTRLASPFHVLQASMAINLMRSLKIRKQLPSWASRYVFHGSRWFYRGLRRVNKIGRNCQIHPTAVIEGAELGDNVKVGAFCVVRLSKVGAGSVIEDQCCIKYSVLGEKTYISQANQIHLCQVDDESFLIHGPYQFSIFGRKTATMAVINCDYRLDQKNISIPSDVGLLDSRQPLLGIAYGHEAKVGGGNIIAPGRIVPNGLHCPPPDFIKLDF